jgi:hypothetical protein
MGNNLETAVSVQCKAINATLEDLAKDHNPILS